MIPMAPSLQPAPFSESGSDYRGQLSAELARRRLTHPSYSLRAFARTLGLSPAFLSKLLSGQKDLSLEKAALIAERLGYNREEIAQFCHLVQLGKARTVRLRDALGQDESETREFAPLTLEAFQVISDWQHYAILELVSCRGFKMSGEYVARRLGIEAAQAVAALNRLVRLGLLKQSKGRWVKSSAFIATPTDKPSRALRNFHAQMIEKAKLAIELQPTDSRDITGLTVPISRDKLEVAKQEIRAFRRRMAKLMDSSRPDSVYQLNIQFFSLSASEDH
jgi:uncharacterized protein (TIGR02147 family)